MHKLFVFFVSLLIVGNVHSSDLLLGNTPLPISSAEQNNLMILFDTSGSMRAVVPEANGDISDVTDNYYKGDDWDYTNGVCHSGFGVSSNPNWYLDGDNRPLFYHSGSYGYWSTVGGYCFKPDVTYTMTLQKNSFVPGGGGSAKYKGNFLNWYFCKLNNTTGYCSNNLPDPFETKTETHPTLGYQYQIERRELSRDRLWLGKSSMIDFVTGLNDLRVGLATFSYVNEGCIDPGLGWNCGSSSSKAEIRHGIEKIDEAGHRNEILNTLENVTINGNTPLSGSYATIGRYFLEGYQSQTLKYGNQAKPALVGDDVLASTVFSYEPNYSAGVTKPTTGSPVIVESCQNSFMITVTDGLPSADSQYSGTIRNYTGSGSHWKNTASALFDLDLRPDLDDGDPMVDSPQDKQNITSYIIGFGDGLSGVDFSDIAAAGGGSYISASNETGLTDALNQMATNVRTSNGSLAAVAFNATQLDTGSAVFQAKFHTENWTGSLEAYALDGTSGEVAADKTWEARQKLDAMVLGGSNTRTILSYADVDLNGASDGVAFQWQDSFSTLLQTSSLRDDLNDVAGLNNGLGASRLNYIRGDRTNEGVAAGSFKTRPTFDAVEREHSGLLGDIVNSAPVFVGKPESSWPDDFGIITNTHSMFKAGAAKDRTPVVYVGANDGMLHGFHASIEDSDSTEFGKELIAYVPSMLANTANTEGLHYLSDQGYDHNDYVDLTPTIEDVYIDTIYETTPSVADRDWHTVLVGGLRAGGKGYFALDVTDPSLFSEANAEQIVLWEFDENDDFIDGTGDLGYSFSKPVIAKMNNGKWAAIFGNGYNSVNGSAKLFIVFIEDGADGVWGTGDYLELETNVGTSTDKNGLSSPAIADLDADGIVDRVYAGDLKGNLWVFDVTANNTSNWEVAYRQGTTYKPLFTATNDSNEIESITAAPILALNTANPSGGDPNVSVLFGTGQYIQTADIRNTEIQRFYSVADSGDHSLEPSNLMSRTMYVDHDFNADHQPIRTYDDPTTDAIEVVSTINWNTKHGWYINLQEGSGSGINTIGSERVVTSPLLRGDVIFFNTIIPDGTPCQNTGGSGWMMAVDFKTGAAPNFGTFDANLDGVIDELDQGAIGQYSGSGLLSQPAILGDHRYTTTSSGELIHDQISTGDQAKDGRRGWEEIILK